MLITAGMLFRLHGEIISVVEATEHSVTYKVIDNITGNAEHGGTRARNGFEKTAREIKLNKDGSKNNVQDLTPADFPPGVPAFKWKRGLFYRSNNSGYTDRLIEAGIYTREDVIGDCFDSDGVNGSCDVYGMNMEMALRQNFYNKDKIYLLRHQLDILEKYATEFAEETIIF